MLKGANVKPKLSKKSRYKNGEIAPSKLTKFKPTEKSPTFVYRSSYEYVFCMWCEYNANVVSWSSEPYSIEYYCPVKKKLRSYWIDFISKMIDGQKIIIEVKPEKDLQAVKIFQQTFARLTTAEAKTSYIQANKIAANNYGKWQAAKKYAKQNGMQFQVVTEKFLKSYI
jgi:hypothetical protein